MPYSGASGGASPGTLAVVRRGGGMPRKKSPAKHTESADERPHAAPATALDAFLQKRQSSSNVLRQDASLNPVGTDGAAILRRESRGSFTLAAAGHGKGAASLPRRLSERDEEFRTEQDALRLTKESLQREWKLSLSDSGFDSLAGKPAHKNLRPKKPDHS